MKRYYNFIHPYALSGAENTFGQILIITVYSGVELQGQLIMIVQCTRRDSMSVRRVVQPRAPIISQRKIAEYMTGVTESYCRVEYPNIWQLWKMVARNFGVVRP